MTWTQKAAGTSFKCKVAALSNNGSYDYPKEVNMEIQQDELEEYLWAADEINANDKIKAVCVQHEFGIFGGEMGQYIIPFLEELKKPVVTTFHSVLPGDPLPSRDRLYMVKKICENSDKVVVISGFGQDILHDKYRIPRHRVIPIPHGVPEIPFGTTEKAKKRIGFEGRTVISTFGLMSKRKGLQYVIRALPKVVKEHPEVLYLIIGKTHPVVKKKEGEVYRKSLIKEVRDLGLKNNVMFFDEFLPLKKLCALLEATDIYITPYYDPQQISSGTLAYAIGAGKACISTPYLYAEDALRDNRGLFSRFKSHKDMSDNINTILDNKELRQSLEFNAYSYSRAWKWASIGGTYLELFKSLIRNKKN